MKYVGVLLVVVALGYVEVPGLLRRRAYREAVVVAVVLLLGGGLGVALAGDLSLPTVSVLIQRVSGPLVQIR